MIPHAFFKNSSLPNPSGPSSVNINTFIIETWSKWRCTLDPSFTFVRCLESIKGIIIALWHGCFSRVRHQLITQLRIIHWMVWRSRKLSQWLLGVCEVFQTSWGGDPSGVPSHAQMFTDVDPASDSVLYMWWVQFQPLAEPTTCMSLLDDPFKSLEPFLVQKRFLSCDPPSPCQLEG